MKTKIQGIYKIRNCINSKVYIGQSIDIENRFEYHKKCGILYYDEHPLYNSMKCYGMEAFEFIILEEISNVLLLDQREQYWMDYYKSYDRSYGYNIVKQARSTIGYKHTEESKLKMSLFQKGKKHSEEHKRKISQANKGKIITKEARLKVSLALTGKKLSEEVKLKMALTKQGKKHTEEAKRKISLSNKGRIPWNKGISMSNEQKLKISQTLKERKILNRDRNLKRKRLSVLDIQKLQCKTIIQFKQVC